MRYWYSSVSHSRSGLKVLTMNKPENHSFPEHAEGRLDHLKNPHGGEYNQAVYDPDEAYAVPDTPAERRYRNRILLLTFLAICAAIAGLYYLSRAGSEPLVEAPNATLQAVSVINVEGRLFQRTVSLNGEVRPVRDIQVAAPATGVRIMQILVDEGDTVSEGQPMAQLDIRLAAAQLRASEASVAEAQSAAVTARGEYERAESIRESGALSTEAIEQRRAAAIAAEARLSAAQAQLAEVNARLGGGYVRAPVSGLVIDRMVELGRPVDGQVLFRIAVDNRLEVAAEVAEADTLALSEGQIATFALVDGSEVQGTLRRLPASIDSSTRTGEALFDLPLHTRARAGMYLRGEVALPPNEVIAAPQSSIMFDDGQAYLFTLDEKSCVHRTDVHTGRRDGEWVELTEGLSLAQRIVGSGAAFLQEGEEVRILEENGAITEPNSSASVDTPGTADNTRDQE